MQITIDPERFKKIKLWILVPAAQDLIHATFSQNLIKLLGALRTHNVWYELRYMPGDSLVTRARNNLADVFMQASSDDNLHFSLWLDCDILFDAESVLQMLALNKDFVAAPYSKKGFHVDRMKEAVHLGWDNDKIMRSIGTPNVNWLVNPVSVVDPHPVLESGSGFWLIKRKVFRMIQEAYGEDHQDGPYFLPGIKYKRAQEEVSHYGTEYAYDYFKVGVWPDTKEYLSEDWWVCRVWRKLGGTVEECFWIKTYHIGMHVYPMDMPVIAELLNATGGVINGPARGEKDATERNITSGSGAGGDSKAVGGDRGNGGGQGGSSGPGYSEDIRRAIIFALGQERPTGAGQEGPSSQATVESSAGPLGSGVCDQGGT